MREVKVEYTGGYPVTCTGNLLIYLDGELEYKSPNGSFYSTGNVWFDEEWNEHVESGELRWKEAQKEQFLAWAKEQREYNDIIQEVRRVLSRVNVCCGGCV